MRAETRAVDFGAQDEIPIEFATGIVVNFVNNDFIISFVQARPPIFDEHTPLPERVQGKILIRVAMSAQNWVNATASLAKQVEALQNQGAVPKPGGAFRPREKAD